MDINIFRVDYQFPDRAGELQRSDRPATLIAELGDNYAKYHAVLAKDLERIGSRPEPRDFNGDFNAYQAANRHLADVLRAESALRFAYKLRSGGREALSELGSHPLVDDNERLVDVRDPAPGPNLRAIREQPIAKVPPPEGF